MKMISRLLMGLVALLALIFASTLWCPLMELLVGPNGLFTNALAQASPSTDSADSADNTRSATGMAAASSNSDATAGALNVRAAGMAGAYVGATARTRDRRLSSHHHDYHHKTKITSVGVTESLLQPRNYTQGTQGGLHARVGMILWAEGRSATDTFAHSLLATGGMSYCNRLKEGFKTDHPPLSAAALQVRLVL